MESSVLQGDRVFLTVFVSLLVGLVTAALSIVRLVNDKEGKTTDYRQNWCDSVRKCFAEMISNINATASLIVNHRQDSDHINALLSEVSGNGGPFPENRAAVRDLVTKRITESESQIRTLRRELYQAYALTRLHFKPNDPTFFPIERNFELAVELIRGLTQMSGSDARAQYLAQRDKIHVVAAEMTTAGREILKTEWEIVKKGERAYELTKQGSIFGGGAALTILFLLGGAAMLSIGSAGIKANIADKSAKSPSEGVSTGVGVAPGGSSPNAVTQIVNVNPIAYSLPATRDFKKSIPAGKPESDHYKNRKPGPDPCPYINQF